MSLEASFCQKKAIFDLMMYIMLENFGISLLFLYFCLKIKVKYK